MEVGLRRPKAGDAAARAVFGRHPEIVRGYGVELDAPQAMTEKEAEAWVQRIEANPQAWVITHNGGLVGEIKLFNLNPADQWACLAIGLADAGRLGQGIGRQAIGQCLSIAFRNLGLHRISIRVLASNARAIACYARCGFITEGRERQSARVGDHWEDDVIMGILAHDYLSAR